MLFLLFTLILDEALGNKDFCSLLNYRLEIDYCQTKGAMIK